MRRYRFHRGPSVWSFISGLVILAYGADASYELTRSTISSSASPDSTGGGYQLSSSVGQPGSSTMVGGGYELTGGFELKVGPTDCDEDGTVGLFDYVALELCFTGPTTMLFEGCECLDVNMNGTVDLADFAIAQEAFNDG